MHVVKVLGTSWNTLEDCVCFSVADVYETAIGIEPTKRNVISTIGKFYDPLGLLSPVIIRFKVLFQKLCERRLQWDEVLPELLKREWELLVRDLCDGGTVTIPRFYFEGINDDVCSHTLCGFCDASMAAYAAVVYIVARTQRNTYTRFVVAKTRVASLQVVTIPRLELLSALLLSRLITTVSLAIQFIIQAIRPKPFK